MGPEIGGPQGVRMVWCSGWLEDRQVLASGCVTRFALGFLLAGWDVGDAGWIMFSTLLKFQPGFWLKNYSFHPVY